jgi:hypothetical protein
MKIITLAQKIWNNLTMAIVITMIIRKATAYHALYATSMLEMAYWTLVKPAYVVIFFSIS